MSSCVLVLGGTRSGKSRYALERARAAGGDAVTFIATARAGDRELDARIAAHRAVRPSAWTTVEIDRDLAGAMVSSDPGQVLLVDSLTLWASTIVEAESTLGPRWKDVRDALACRERPVVLVSDAVGMGVIPIGALARRFVDELGWLEQRVAEVADEVQLMVAGIPVAVKGAEGRGGALT